VSDEWQWFWASESGRDRLLRDEVEGLHARLSSASSQSRRLSSQLAALSGSIESRLDALSAAFDAYVELGDVREQLAGWDRQADVRREVAAGLEALAQGRPVQPIDPRGLDYWLPYAMNATIALAEGRRDSDAEQQARSLSPETDAFLVAAAGVLGHGDRVGHLLPSLLVTDGQLTPVQQSLWTAAAQGAYGDVADRLEPVWRPAIAAEPVSSWTAWVTAQRGNAPSQAVSWIAALLSGDASIGQTDAGPAPQDRLRAVVVELVGRGMPEEAELLARARELRDRIEHPERAHADPAADAVTVVAEVRRAVTAQSTTPEFRRTLLGWLAAPLLGVVDTLVQQSAEIPAAESTVRRGDAKVRVTAAGADPAEVEASVVRIRASHQVSPRLLLAWAVGTGVALLAALIAGVVSNGGWALLLVLVAAGGAIGTVRQLLHRRRMAIGDNEDLAALARGIDEATRQAVETDRARSEAFARLSAEADRVRTRLTALSGGSAAVGGPPEGAAGPAPRTGLSPAVGR
jgi:hypothetical protein